ncbi:helix-turn-helix domain-containing protein [Litoreibacter arenae]|nr:AraC family transcriptional regulator [Litoreibacter arenae]
MGKSDTPLWPKPTAMPETPPVLSRTTSDGVLRFECREEAPASVAPQKSAHFSFIISAQDDPIRLIADRDGHTERFTLSPDDIAVAVAGGLTGWQWLDPAKVMIVHVNPAMMKRFVQTELKIVPDAPNHFAKTFLFQDDDVKALIAQMGQTLTAAEVGAEVMFEALARMFLVLMFKRYGRLQRTEVAFDHSFGADQYGRVVDYIEAHLDKKISPAQLAEELGMSEAAFSRKFKARVGETPMRFVAQVRLEAASRLLGQGVLSLAQIAARCGFADQAHMSRSFKQQLGVSPSQFRKARLDT